MHFDRLDYWTELAGICEEAHLDFLFLADAWGWAEINGERPRSAASKASSFHGSTRQPWPRRWCPRPRTSGW
jgi:alkanesulfonate monooxygenase SsuD/methylene tetrahydromethanopterin reductase-like flavin-dependent oxidoreductase (luciferase family)